MAGARRVHVVETKIEEARAGERRGMGDEQTGESGVATQLLLLQPLSQATSNKEGGGGGVIVSSMAQTYLHV